MAEKHWIKGAIKHPGSFSSAARKAGKSTAEFARIHQHDSGTLGRRARLAKTLMKMESGGVVESAPAQKSTMSRLADLLFGRKALQEAGRTGDRDRPPAPPQPQTDIGAVRQAAQQAAERLERERQSGKEPRSYACGGVIMGRYGKR